MVHLILNWQVIANSFPQVNTHLTRTLGDSKKGPIMLKCAYIFVSVWFDTVLLW